MRKLIILGLPLVAVIGCQPAAMRVGSSDLYETSSADFAVSEGESAKVAQLAESSQANGKKLEESFLAYRYGYGLVMPAASVKSTSEKHIQICRKAGPKLCQITGSNTNTNSQDRISADISLRAEPDWLVGFVNGLKSDVADVDGRIQSETTSVEDLTRAILDTDARLKAQRTLRTRLENLLETQNAELTDLLALERELARVQGEIESATATLKALRTRVSMSVVNINYSSERVAVSSSSFSPIGYALKEFVSTLSHGIAGVIYFFAYMLPWTIFIILPGFFAIRWLWRRRKNKPKVVKVTEARETTA